ncbi:MAG: Lytic transglycosylase catalytic [Verrucomicrobia bacterium]|nr:Lytic transglycosylase catalytic [Verrucomicrobiota bacterium]
MRTIGLILIVGCLAGCARRATERSAAAPTREEIWSAIRPLAQRYRLAPGFIYALVAAESNFNPAAQNGEARGLLQIKPRAWRTVSKKPYEPEVWNWRTNLEVGVDYLAYSRAYLHRRDRFSYPLLLAAFHYGLDFVEAEDFSINGIDPPDNAIYRELWRGNLKPVAPPK